ncbi:MAG: hypothetical protein AAF602_33580 [Myxococcota bacterium]
MSGETQELWPELDADGEALYAAIASDDHDAIRAVVARRPELPGSGIGVLHRCVADNRPEAAGILVACGADLDERNPDGRTALHDSLEYSRRAMTAMLVQAGATIDVCSAAILGDVARLEAIAGTTPEAFADLSTGLSVLGWASYGGHPEVVEVLVRHGVALDVADGLFPAAQCDHHRFVAEVIGGGVDPNGTAGASRSTTLHVAVQLSFTEHATHTVTVLLDAGADRSIKDARGRTPLDVARIAAEASTNPRKDFAAVIALLEAH